MRTIDASQITAAVAKLAVDANYYLSNDVRSALENAREHEESPLGKTILDQLVENACIARDEQVPICQDTGMAVVFIEIGQDVHVTGGSIEEAVNAGVAKGYTEGYLRKSVVAEPLFNRKNTGNNTPAVLHTTIVQGDKIKITLAPKGFGSENMSALKMFKPSDGLPAIRKFVVDTIFHAGSNPCPPIIVGIGIGGTMEKAAFLAKKALIRPIDKQNSHAEYARLEKEFLDLINQTGVGPQGLGGRVTALAVNIEYYPTHIAGLPVAININCHATRHAEVEL
ncbi:fumarate hydratase [Sporomusa acidovorans]|uniref:L(+)-tartrate dehydratase subunit alpha n=1 Tax=Sporomusa acidovorans (strain ATCC 49682 / DSM 3132 / Mol) TaxID=1123286 RepID=A0ABZ3J1C4_SPOA4|nr:fumarate hydratase [Sporomusa acidovorans]OZC22803.1 L(+)-tartrate dehydratase subunit alpha [Sporomusa acidovorans DSM 3132]SDE51414.1 fumarase, class I alpha subunit [Sporomusa acidovorans]